VTRTANRVVADRQSKDRRSQERQPTGAVGYARRGLRRTRSSALTRPQGCQATAVGAGRGVELAHLESPHLPRQLALGTVLLAPDTPRCWVTPSGATRDACPRRLSLGDYRGRGHDRRWRNPRQPGRARAPAKVLGAPAIPDGDLWACPGPVRGEDPARSEMSRVRTVRIWTGRAGPVRRWRAASMLGGMARATRRLGNQSCNAVRLAPVGIPA
jgi:hypothetical protein